MIQLQINGNNSYLLPETSDRGDVFFPALAQDISFMNSHVHDGVKGQFNPVVTQVILAASWAAAPIGGGLFRQLVTMPNSMAYANFQLQFRLANGNIVELSVEPQSANTYYVYINDNSQTIVAVYSS